MTPLQTSIRKAESGQAIVIVALLVVALIAILGVAIDGGGLYFLHRDTQNAVDAAVLAATYARCTGGDIIKAGVDAARLNGFVDGNGTTVIVNNPPATGPGATNDRYVEVSITAPKPSYFIQVVYPQPLQVTTRAVGYCTPPFDPTTVPALFAIAENRKNDGSYCGNEIRWGGSSSTMIGGMFSNNEVQWSGGGNGNEIYDGTFEEGSGAAGGVNYQDQNSDWFTGDPQDNDPPVTESLPLTYQEPKPNPIDFLKLSDFAPGGAVAKRAALYTAILGEADDEDFKSNGTWDPANNRVLEGLYYVNGDVNIGNGVIVDGDRNGDGEKDGLTIVATGGVSFNAGSGMALKYYIDGILIFSNKQADNCGDNDVDVSGSAVSMMGVIYAPHTGVAFSLSDIDIVGTIIADQIQFDGSDLDFIYDPSILPPRVPTVEIAE